ncbi:GTPase Era [Acaryochloris thomasi RCC1774]|uniref:GTPase Era n=1 Tax=Acaryochloris thomasi RCC1774 TaxID=1764569 RepID=A0A2W1JG08_9CYAN|nr:GTP-binding protein [Acaryochloris thomasi]PZD72560.1 GTPase Era [Acaryochloris thomasi RCC1774]
MPLDAPDSRNQNPTDDLIQLESDLEQAIQDFERIQSDLGYQHAQESLQMLVQKLDLSRREQAGLESEIASLQSMLDKLENQVVHIAVFGLVSRGKSSLLNALVGQSIFATGPTHGVTQTTQQARWDVAENADGLVRVSLAGNGRSQVQLIDTPGIDEIAGEEREQLAKDVAQQADLILFVIAGDLTKVEYEALSNLRQASKPLLLVFNKVDQYPEADRQLIYEKIRDDRVRELLSPDEIVMASAAPLMAKAVTRADGSLGAELVPGPPQITDLKLKILEILNREGKALVALNTLLYADEIHEQVVQRKMEIRDRSANQIIWQSVMTKGVAIALNPITLVDILSSAVIDIAMILTLSKLYGISMTQQGAVGLLRNIAVAMGGISATELLATFGLSSLKGILGVAAPVTGGASLVPYLSVAITQAAVAGVSSYSIGQVTKQYLSNGASWGPQGPKTVVTEILESLDQTYILNRIKAELRQKLDPMSRA